MSDEQNILVNALAPVQAQVSEPTLDEADQSVPAQQALVVSDQIPDLVSDQELSIDPAAELIASHPLAELRSPVTDVPTGGSLVADLAAAAAAVTAAASTAVSASDASPTDATSPCATCSCACGHKHCKTIVDIFSRADDAVKEWEKSKANALTPETKLQTKADVLAPFVEELDKAMPVDSDSQGIDFGTARALDDEFFGTGGNTTHWRAAFKYPAIGTVLHSKDFGYTVPVCGYVVLDHGLMTMSVALNDPKVLHATQQRRVLEQEHDAYHRGLEAKVGTSDHDHPASNPTETPSESLVGQSVEQGADTDPKAESQCAVFGKKMQDLLDEIEDALVPHYKGLENDADEDPDYD